MDYDRDPKNPEKMAKKNTTINPAKYSHFDKAIRNLASTEGCSDINLPKDIKKHIECKFNIDPSDIKIVENSVLKNTGIDGYANGNIIGVAPGKFSQDLLDHELAHIVQQATGLASPKIDSPFLDDISLENSADLAKIEESSYCNLNKIKPLSPNLAPIQTKSFLSRIFKCFGESDADEGTRLYENLYFGDKKSIDEKNRNPETNNPADLIYNNKLPFLDNPLNYKEAFLDPDFFGQGFDDYAQQHKLDVSEVDDPKRREIDSKKSYYLESFTDAARKYGRYIIELHPYDLIKRSELNFTATFAQAIAVGYFIKKNPAYFDLKYNADDIRLALLTDYFLNFMNFFKYVTPMAYKTRPDKKLYEKDFYTSDIIASKVLDSYCNVEASANRLDKLGFRLKGFSSEKKRLYAASLEDRGIGQSNGWSKLLRNRARKEESARKTALYRTGRPNGPMGIPYAQVERRLEIDRNELPDMGITGIRNLGCSCYINSLLQQLFRIPDFVEYIKMNDFIKLDQNIENPSEQAIASNMLFHIKKIMNLIIAKNGQGALQENEIRGHLTEGLGYNRAQEDTNDTYIRIIDAYKTLSERSNIPMCFRIKEKKFLKQAQGDTVEYEHISDADKSGTFSELIVTVPNENNSNVYSLSDLIASDFRPEVIEGFRGYSNPVENRKSIAYAPNTLVIQLKRFGFDNRTLTPHKITNKIDVPEYLDLTPFMDENGSGEPIDSPQYELTGVQIHTGEELKHGHYYSYIRKLHSEQWLKYNDETVYRPTKEASLDDINKKGYMLYYTRTSPISLTTQREPQLIHPELAEP